MATLPNQSFRLAMAVVLLSPVLLASASADADSDTVVEAATCSATDVQAALNAAPDGATVEIPAGNCDWGATQVTRDAGITVRGAGRALTTIRRTAQVTTDLHALLRIDCANGKTVEIAAIGFLGNDDLQDESQRLLDKDIGVALVNGCADFEVHDATFSKFSHAGLAIMGHRSRGVVYGTLFLSNFKCQVDPVDCLGYGVVIAGDEHRPRPPLALGTRNAVFVEDNYFWDNRHGIASNHGSRYVARHNTFESTQRTRDFGMLDAHGRKDGLPGSRSWEIYANVLRTDPPSMIAAGIVTRGGDGVVFGNTMEQIPWVTLLSNERCPAHGRYPLRDQTTAAYVWDNDWDPVPGYDDEPIWVADGCERYLQEGRDFFAVPRPGYAPYAYPHPLR